MGSLSSVLTAVACTGDRNQILTSDQSINNKLQHEINDCIYYCIAIETEP